MNNYLLIYDYLINKLPDSLNSLFTINTSENYNTRFSNLITLKEKRFKSVKYGKNSISNKSSKLWNSYSKINCITDLKMKRNSFKNNIKNYLLKQY